MAETRKPKIKWDSPKALASLTGDGLLSIARSTGRTVGFIQSGTKSGLSKVEHGLSWAKHALTWKKKKSKQQTEPDKEEFLQQEEGRETAADTRQETASSDVQAEELAETISHSIPEKRPAHDKMIERIRERISSLQTENEHLMEKLFTSEDERGEAAQEINRLKKNIEDRQEVIHSLGGKLSDLENSFEAAEEISEKRDTAEEAVISEAHITPPVQEEKQIEPVREEHIPQGASPEVDAVPRQEAVPSMPVCETTGPMENKLHPVMEETQLSDNEIEPMRTKYPPMNIESDEIDMEALLKQRFFRDRVEAIKVRKAMDDLLHGSEVARLNALKTLVGLCQVAEPFLIAALKKASPQVAEIALEGLSQIDSDRLVSCISDAFASPDHKLRIVALRVAQRLTDDTARSFLDQGLHDPSEKVKRRALSYLSWRDSSWALARITRLCEDPNPDVKWAALEALLAIKPSEAYDTLELMMSSLDPIHRRRALTLLERRKSLPSPARKINGNHTPRGNVRKEMLKNT